MKLKVLAIIAALTLASSMALTGCGGSSSSSNSSSAASSSSSAATSSSAAEEATVDSDYEVTIDDFTTDETFDGMPAAVVTYTFTNNSEKATSFAVAVSAKAFQDGVQLDTGVVSGNNGVQDSLKEIKTGGSITFDLVYVLDNETSPVTIEVSEMFNFNDELIATETFDL